MATIFDNFKDWFPVFDSTEAVLAIIDDHFNPGEHRQVAARVLEQFAKDNGNEHGEDARIEEVIQDPTKERIKDYVGQGFALYGRQLDDIIKNKFNELWNNTPNGVKGELLTFVTFFKPKSDAQVSGKIEEALKYHKFLTSVGSNVNEYQSRNTSATRRKEIDKEFLELLEKGYKEKYLDTPQKEALNKDMIEVFRKWDKKASARVFNNFRKKQEEAQEKFEELITQDNFREYMTTVLDNENLRKLYGTATVHWDHAERDKKVKEARDMYVGA